MNLTDFIIGWFYYSIYYMLFSVFATLMLNRVTKKLWLSPLIINAVSILILIFLVKNNLIKDVDATYTMYFNYMPIVFASVLVNCLIALKRKLVNKKIQQEEV